ncbi:hypothetical protein KI387_022517, partial [Taxus chinensis]
KHVFLAGNHEFAFAAFLHLLRHDCLGLPQPLPSPLTASSHFLARGTASSASGISTPGIPPAASSATRRMSSVLPSPSTTARSSRHRATVPLLLQRQEIGSSLQAKSLLVSHFYQTVKCNFHEGGEAVVLGSTPSIIFTLPCSCFHAALIPLLDQKKCKMSEYYIECTRGNKYKEKAVRRSNHL